MERHLPNKSLVQQITCDFSSRENVIGHSICTVSQCCFTYSEMPEHLSSKWFTVMSYHKCLTWLCSQTSGIRIQDNMTVFIVCHLWALRRKSFMM